MARIVFDLDGTLIDSALDLHNIACDVMSEEGHPPITVDQARSFIGHGVDVFVTKLRSARRIPDADHDRILAKFKERYQDAVHLTLIYPGVKQALDALVQAGHNLGICTNKPMVPCMAVLKHLDLEKYFQVVRAGDSLPVHKPDPAPLYSAYSDLPPGPEIFVGDSEVDAETAMRAKVPFLLFTEGYRKKPVGLIPHTQSFSHHDGLPDLVDALLADSENARSA
ncbi:Phosphoglycolate phosphatase, chromosomal [Ruegeria sp. THAF57]|uniref:HAD-IA family hydrolase n=1 Tax=Ruegeria sp. THAF57 TaxID=2744555 RepID=UPI0015DDB07A|nr:HAD-IA family hydrolase [Ruegeria sp. THAF57]CAD0186810.1 Phosphoglycolate phosphatase, chromosomal [Ruegeria sp. THAF57]